MDKKAKKMLSTVAHGVKKVASSQRFQYGLSEAVAGLSHQDPPVPNHVLDIPHELQLLRVRVIGEERPLAHPVHLPLQR